jgi:hypothetical protein
MAHTGHALTVAEVAAHTRGMAATAIVIRAISAHAAAVASVTVVVGHCSKTILY